MYSDVLFYLTAKTWTVVQNNDGFTAKWDVKGDVLTVNKTTATSNQKEIHQLPVAY